jgi:hypothetical protein
MQGSSEVARRKKMKILGASVCVTTTKKINDDVVASQKSAKILSDPTS